MKNWLKIPGILTRRRAGGGGLLRRTFIVSLLLISAGLMTSGALELFFRYRESLEVIGSLQQEMAQGAAFKVRQYIRDIEKTMRASTQTRENVSRGLSDAFRFPLLKLMKVSPAISTVVVYSTEGREVLKESRIELVVSVKGGDHSADPAYQTAREGRSYFGPVYFVRQSEPYMRIAVPLEWFQGQVEGVLVADVNLKHIWEVISRIRVGESGYAYIVSGDGDLIAHPDISLVLQKLNLSHLEHVKAALEGGSTELTSQPNLAGLNVFSTYAHIPDLNWAVMVERPVSEAFAPLYASLFRNALLLLVGLGMAIAASLIVGRNVLRPLEVLREGAERIGAGELRHRIDIQTGDELEALASEFNNMAGQLEAERLGLEQKVEERTQELTHSLDQQTAIGDILRVISTSPTELQSVFDTILDNACNLCHADFGILFLYENSTYRNVAFKGVSQDIMDKFPIWNDLDPHPESGMGRMIHEMKPIQFTDIKDTEGYRQGIPERVAAVDGWGVRSVLHVPLLKENQLQGLVIIFRKYVEPFSHDHVDLVETFADQAVIAIGNARLLEALQDRTTELTQSLAQQTAIGDILRVISTSQTDLQSVFDTILENACRLCQAEFGVLQLYAESQFEVVAFKGVENLVEKYFPGNKFTPHSESGLGRMITEKKPIQFTDLENSAEYINRVPERVVVVEEWGMHSILIVPLLKDGELEGVVVIFRKISREFFQEQIELVQTFADQAVIAIGNARLLEALQDRTTELTQSLAQQTAIGDILRVISTSPAELQSVFDTILENACNLCHADFGVLQLYDESQYEVVSFKGVGNMVEKYFPGNKITPHSESGLGRMITEKKPIQFTDLENSAEYIKRVPERVIVVEEWGMRSILHVPLLKDGELEGVVIIFRKISREFSQDHVELVETFADQAVIAIDNARLLEALQDRTDELSKSVNELQALSEVGQAVSSILDLETVLTTIVTRAVELSGARGGLIFEFDEDASSFALTASHGADPELIAKLQSTSIQLGEGALGTAAQEKGPVQVPDMREDDATVLPWVREIMLRNGNNSLLSVPLLQDQQIMGGLVVWRREPGNMPEDVVRLLQSFATQSTLAIQNARLFHQIEERGKELEVASRHKSEFLANMSHELRTPLNAILGYTELIRDGIYGELPEKVEDVMGRVQKSGSHLLNLINDVLDLSKIEAGQLDLSLGKYSMQDLVKNVYIAVESLADEKQLELTLDFSGDLPVGTGDEQRITQVLMNLAGNAIKFTESGTVGILAGAENGAFRVAVSDTGPGIPEEAQKEIFDEFRQADSSSTKTKGGTGLGLAIAKKFIEMHGGKIGVESTVSVGSTFWFELPVLVEQQKEIS